MANDRNRTDEQFSGPSGGSQSDSGEDVRNGMGEDVRGVADEGDDEEFEDMDDLEEDDDSDGSSF